MLWELSVAEQRYRAVLEVGAGVPVTEVAARYGVSRQSVHTWLRRYRQEAIAGLEDRSHRVHDHPWRIAAEIEETICELRRAHPGWGPRRLVFEMDRLGYGTVTRSAVYRTLVRNGLIDPQSRRRSRKDYRRCERPVPMQLWQLMVARQNIRAGMIHAGKTATVTCENNHFRIVVDGETAAVVPRTTTSEIHRYKANATQPKTVTPCPE
jgi:transposase